MKFFRKSERSEPEPPPPEHEELVCYCFHVPKQKIIRYIRQNRPKRVTLISQCLGAGTGCGCCIPDLEALYREEMAALDAESDPSKAPDKPNP